MRRRLTEHQEQRLDELRKKLRQRWAIKQRTINWAAIDQVVGTRDRVTPWSTESACARCHLPVFTSFAYPVGVPIVCEVCTSDQLVAEEVAGS